MMVVYLNNKQICLLFLFFLNMKRGPDSLRGTVIIPKSPRTIRPLTTIQPRIIQTLIRIQGNQPGKSQHRVLTVATVYQPAGMASIWISKKVLAVTSVRFGSGSHASRTTSAVFSSKKLLPKLQTFHHISITSKH